jgi:hypothetical protein
MAVLALLALRVSERLDDGSPALQNALIGTRAVLVLGGLVAVGWAIVRRPRSALVLGVAAAAASAASWAIDEDWDTARLALALLTLVAAVAAVLVLLPRIVSRVIVSAVILIHFGAILTAVTSVPPQPWLSNYLWTHFYRPYVEFMYLNNAYHFYSPEPGPTTLVWFYAQYDDGTMRRFEMPRREDHALTLEYQRRLSLTESVNQLLAPLPAVPQETRYRRLQAGQEDGIPLHPEVAENMQYRIPSPFSQRMLQSYARHIAGWASRVEPDRKLVGIKIYRVMHSLMTPRDVALGRNPEDPALYFPYYQGEFDSHGKLKKPDDPYLYWLLPIIRYPETDDPRDRAQRVPQETAKPQSRVLNCLNVHLAIDQDEEQ